MKKVIGEIYCRFPTCDEHIKNTRWDKTRAQAFGWYFTKDGHAHCPKHLPHWKKK